MDRAGIVSRIRNRLGYNTGLSESLILDAIDDAQDILELLPELPWFLESGDTTMYTVADSQTIPTPTGFIREINENALWYYDATAEQDWVELHKGSLPELKRWYATDADNSGKPQAYAVQDNLIYIYPKPDAVYTLRWNYFKAADKLTSASDTNVWSLNVPQMLLNRAGILIAENNRDKVANDIFTKGFAEAASIMRVASEAREHAGQVYQRGGED